MRKSIFILSFAASLILGAVASLAGPMSARFLFVARMNGIQEVPGTGSPGFGAATFNYNNTGDTLCVTMTVSALTGPIAGVHIHEGAAGTNGGIVVDLNSYRTGNSLQATLTGSALGSLSRQKMLEGQYYINVHTPGSPNGEIRGQILLEEDKGMMVNMVGANEVPPVATNARGLAFFKFSSHGKALNIYVVLDSLVGTITGAHLHKQVAGVNGGIIQDLSTFVSGNVISATVDPSAYMSAIMADSVYINVHTTANPGGQIRGQLHFEPYLHFDARMSALQEVPPAASSAQGLGVFRLNYALDSIWYDVLTHGLTGPINAAHIHNAPAGQNQPALIGFPPASITGSHISGVAPTSTFGTMADSLQKELLEGRFYVNVHTSLFPGGECRGQIYRTMREGYTFAMGGDQEVSPVSTAAYGSGMVSMDRDERDVKFLIAATQITPISAFFHRGVVATTGPGIFDLAPFMASGFIGGYWSDTAAVPFSRNIAKQFQDDSIYVNMFTAANAAGEIRGQVMRSLCTGLPSATATAVNPVSLTSPAIEIVPNPVTADARLRLWLPKSVQAKIQLTDVSGRIIREQDYYFEAGYRELVLPADDLPASMYFLQFISADGKVTRRMLKI